MFADAGDRLPLQDSNLSWCNGTSRLRLRRLHGQRDVSLSRGTRVDEDPPTGDADTVNAEGEGARIRLATASQMDRRLRAKQSARDSDAGPAPTGIPYWVLAAAFVVGVIFVVTPVLVAD